jgi:N-carbamoyl-L-amino-acid hydrolase
MSQSPRLTPDVARIERRIGHLATLTDPALPPYTRRAFSETFLAGRRWLQGEFEDAGLACVIDAGGNLVGRRDGDRPDALPIALGSHSDTVIGGGRYDGIAGVVAALEVANTLADAGLTLRHPLWAIDFLAEEPTDYGTSCVGSRAIAGNLTRAMLEARAPGGEVLADGLRRMGGDPDRVLQGPILGARPLAAFLELHIEQGPVLEQEGLAIGIVSGVVGIRRLLLRVDGQADHAGTTPMHLRHDALVGAAELIALIHRRAREAHPRNGLVATVGRMSHVPNQTNVVPARADVIFEARCADREALLAFMDALVRDGRQAIAPLGLTLQDSFIAESEPTPFAEPVRAALRDAATRRGHRQRDLHSGAGHDAMHMARVCPAGMVFIPCRGGRSHAAEESATPAEVAAGVEVLLDAVLSLDASPPPA